MGDGLWVGDDVSGGVGGGLGAKYLPELLVIGKHGLAVGFVVEQTIEFVGDVLCGEAAGDEFLDNLLSRDDVYQSEMRYGEHDRSQEFLKILAACDMVHRSLRAADEGCFECSGT